MLSKNSEFKNQYLKYNSDTKLVLSGKSGTSTVTAKSSTSNKVQKGYIEVVKNNINKLYIFNYDNLEKKGDNYIHTDHMNATKIRIKFSPIYHTDMKFDISSSNTKVMSVKETFDNNKDVLAFHIIYKKNGTSTITVKEVYSGLSIKFTVKHVY